MEAGALAGAAGGAVEVVVRDGSTLCGLHAHTKLLTLAHCSGVHQRSPQQRPAAAVEQSPERMAMRPLPRNTAWLKVPPSQSAA